MAGICACQSQVEAGRWSSVQVIKLHVALSGTKKARLAKTVEFFGRKDTLGKAIVFQPAEANSPCGMAALLGSKRHEDAEDEERSVYLCLLEGAPYKLAKQQKVKAGAETTTFKRGELVADVKIIGMLKRGTMGYQVPGKTGLESTKVLAENLLVPEEALQDKAANVLTYLPCKTTRPALSAANSNPKFTIAKELVASLIGLGASVCAAEEIAEAVEDGPMDDQDD
jgi:hypothetical protein